MQTRTIDSLIADHAVSIDRAARKLKLASGTSLDYGHLVLATGARNRLLDIPNATCRMCTICASSMTARICGSDSRRANMSVVIGAGFIGTSFRGDRAGSRPRGRTCSNLRAA